MDAARHAHDGGGTVSPALFSRRFVLRGVPGVANLPACRIQRDTGKIALDGSYHAPAPVFGHYRDPVTGEIDGSRFLRRFGNRRRTAAALGEDACGNKG